MTNHEAVVYLEGQWDCMCSEDCQIYTGHKDCTQGFICNDGQALQMAISALQAQDLQPTCNQLATDVISRQVAIDSIVKWAEDHNENPDGDDCIMIIGELPSAQPEIVRCKDCKYGEQDDVGRWFCRSLGCQIGSEDGSGFCADAERRTDG